MEPNTLTSEIRERFGIKSCHMTIDENDFMIMLLKLSNENIEFSCSYENLKHGQLVLIIFPSKYGNVELEVQIDNFYNNDIMFIVEGTIKNRNKNDFFIEFNNFINNLIEQKKRKEERILCNKKNLEILNMINVFTFDYRFRQYKGVIKDISYSGIRVLTNPALLQENGELFSFKVIFKNPEESFFFVKCPIIRKQLFVFEEQKFAEIVFKIGDYIRFKERIDLYFEKINKITHQR